ncbi:YfaZ family outer membrane protein [Shewanella maritima]|uniref:YfaZ family outer membrane protein n=1 Tax=Shewanella maritima TaxID=2520507 RepID=UPI003736AE48
MKKIVLMSAVLATGLVQNQVDAEELTIGLREHAFSAGIGNQISPNANYKLGYLYSEDKGHLADIAVHVTIDNGPHHIEIGPKWVYAWAKETNSGGAIAVGGGYRLMVSNLISLHASAYYAPSVLSFSNVEGYLEYDAKVQLNLSEDFGLHLGYRNKNIDYKKVSEVTFDSGYYLGATLRF